GRTSRQAADGKRGADRTSAAQEAGVLRRPMLFARDGASGLAEVPANLVGRIDQALFGAPQEIRPGFAVRRQSDRRCGSETGGASRPGIGGRAVPWAAPRRAVG